jgi:predicted DNA-binding transcriptional regulator YafY
MPNKGKGNAGEQISRLFALVRFLAECGERGAGLNEILDEIYYRTYTKNSEDLEGLEDLEDLEDTEIPKDTKGKDVKEESESSEDRALRREFDSARKKFSRDRLSLKNLYNFVDSDDNDIAEAGEEDGVIDIVKTGEKGEDGKFYYRYRLKSEHNFMLPMRLDELQLQALITGIKLAGYFIQPLEPAAGELWDKLKTRFPEAVMNKGERLGHAIALSMPVSKLSQDIEIFKKAVNAIDEKKVLKVGQYTDREGKIQSCTISPYALYFKYDAWYLMGRDRNIEQTPTVFRLNRMNVVEVLPNGEFIDCPWEPEELRANIELDFHPTNSEKKYDVKLRIVGFFARAVMETEWFKGEKKKRNGDYVDYEVTLKGLERITLWIMRSLNCIEVLEPKELKDEVNRRVDAYLARRPGHHGEK